MNNIERMFNKSVDMQQYCKGYFSTVEVESTDAVPLGLPAGKRVTPHIWCARCL